MFGDWEDLFFFWTSFFVFQDIGNLVIGVEQIFKKKNGLNILLGLYIFL